MNVSSIHSSLNNLNNRSDPKRQPTLKDNHLHKDPTSLLHFEGLSHNFESLRPLYYPLNNELNTKPTKDFTSSTVPDHVLSSIANTQHYPEFKKFDNRENFDLKYHARRLNIDFDYLLLESNRVGKALPSSRSMREMKNIPYSWAELYEDEAWALPQNHLLDKKFHWWRKVVASWKKSYLNLSHPDPEITKYKLEHNPPYYGNISTHFSTKNDIYPHINDIDCFKHLYGLSKNICQPLINTIFGVSVLGKRRSAINQWIIDVSLKFNFNCSTYSLSIQLLDAYLEKKHKSKAPVNIEKTPELMVICLSCLMLSAAIREHWTNPKSEAYLSIIKQSSTHQFTFEDIILAQSDILNTVHPKFLASYIMFDYCLFFIAELRDMNTPKWNTRDLFDYIQANGLLMWLFEILQRANRLLVDSCVNLCVPGSRLAACFLIFLLSNFCEKDIEKDTKWFRLFSHYVLHMHFDGDISFWWTLLDEALKTTLNKIETENERSKAMFNLWKIAGKNWVISDRQTYYDNNCTPTPHPIIKSRIKRARHYQDDQENISPLKLQRVLSNSHLSNRPDNFN